MSVAASRIRVTLCAAMSIDGKIATRTGDSELSSRSDLRRVHKLRATHDAILVGINTVRIDDPLLNVRHVRGRDPVRIILDAAASLSTRSQIAVTSKKIKTILVASPRADKARIRRLEKLGINVITSAKKSGLKGLLAKLRGLGIRSILVEGGGATNWEFVRQNLVDEAIICIAPRLIGGAASSTLVDGAGFARVALSAKMRLCSCAKRSDELIVRYSKL